VGVALYHPRLRVGALAHVVLPDSTGRPANSAKFADTAIPAMLQELGHAGANHSGLIAKITGGACMFGANGPLQVGLSNVEAVTRALAAAGIRLVAQDCGGSKGRRCSFDPATGSLTVEIMGSPAHVL
jgi:chemotaxis protein CheD